MAHYDKICQQNRQSASGLLAATSAVVDLLANEYY